MFYGLPSTNFKEDSQLVEILGGISCMDAVQQQTFLCVFFLSFTERNPSKLFQDLFAGDTALVPRRRIFSEISQQWKLFLCLSWYFKLNKIVDLFVPTFELLKYSHESKLLLNGLDGWFNTSSKVFLGIGNYGIEMVS